MEVQARVARGRSRSRIRPLFEPFEYFVGSDTAVPIDNGAADSNVRNLEVCCDARRPVLLPLLEKT